MNNGYTWITMWTVMHASMLREVNYIVIHSTVIHVQQVFSITAIWAVLCASLPGPGKAYGFG